MSYIQNGTIEYGDVNKFATGSTTGTTPNPALENINSLWGTGYGRLGYGQITPVLNTVSQNDVISASNWTALVDILNKANKHQSINSTPPADLALPAKNDIIAYQQQYSTLLKTLNTYKLNSLGTGASFRSGNTLSSGWTSEILHNFAITFPTADNARYFFNCGGKIKINFSQSNFSTSSAQAVSTNTLCTQTGDLYISPDSNQSPGNFAYTGFTQHTYGSIATRTTYDTTGGYYGLSTSSKLLYKMTAAGNTGTYLSLSAKTNGVQGVNGDNGNVITIYAKWAVSPVSTTAITGAFSTIVTILYPETTYLNNVWLTPTITAV